MSNRLAARVTPRLRSRCPHRRHASIGLSIWDLGWDHTRHPARLRLCPYGLPGHHLRSRQQPKGIDPTPCQAAQRPGAEMPASDSSIVSAHMRECLGRYYGKPSLQRSRMRRATYDVHTQRRIGALASLRAKPWESKQTVPPAFAVELFLADSHAVEPLTVRPSCSLPAPFKRLLVSPPNSIDS